MLRTSRLTLVTMAYSKLISAADILKTAIRMLENGDADELSLRAIAASLGVKAPSLYRYFPHKDALELAVGEEALRTMLAALQHASAAANPESRFRETAEAYLRFARDRFALYAFVMQHIPALYGSDVGKAVWNLLLEAAGSVSGQPDDTAAAVAIWSFLHGYASLAHSGAFGASGPQGGWELGMTTFVNSLRRRARAA